MDFASTGVKASEGHLQTVDADRLDQIIRDGLALQDSTDVRSIAWGRTEEWDSVAHMQLVAALEAAFGIMIDTDDVIAMSDYQEIRRIVSKNLGTEPAA
jgi:acyl carrier protein